MSRGSVLETSTSYRRSIKNGKIYLKQNKTIEFGLEQLSKEYNKANKKPIAFDFKSASSHLLKENSNYNQNIHYIHYYPGRIFPYVPYYLLSIQAFKHLDGYLLDPFAGSGTILLESMMNPFFKRNALGVEINPIGRLISKVKTTSLNIEKVAQYTEEIISLFRDVKNMTDDIPKFKNREIWFSNNASKKLYKLRNAIQGLEIDTNYKDFFWLCFSSIIRKVAKADPYIPPPVVLKLQKYKDNPSKYKYLKKHLENAENPNVIKLFVKAVENSKNKLYLLNKVKEINDGLVKAEIVWDDTRCIKKAQLSERGRINKDSTVSIAANSIDIIFTSPPYLTAQKYIRTNKLELFWLGYTEKEVSDLEKASIGTEKIQNDCETSSLGIESIDSLLDYALPISPERALMVHKYFRDMIESLREMYHVLKAGGYLIMVVGDNKVLGKRVYTYRLLADAATQIGFKEIVTLKDLIRSRSMLTKRNGTGGLIKHEYIIILRKKVQ